MRTILKLFVLLLWQELSNAQAKESKAASNASEAQHKTGKSRRVKIEEISDNVSVHTKRRVIFILCPKYNLHYCICTTPSEIVYLCFSHIFVVF